MIPIFEDVHIHTILIILSSKLPTVRQPFSTQSRKEVSRATMIRETGPPPPLGEFPHGIDISQPKYKFETVIWSKPPHQFHEEFINLAYVTDRKQNDTIYKTVGNVTTWNRYIVLGFHVYDNNNTA